MAHAIPIDPCGALDALAPEALAPDASAPAPAVTLEALYRAHAAWVWQALRRHGVPADAVDDATQDVFVVVHRRLPEFEARSRVETWIYGIVLRVAKDHRRRRARKGPGEALDDALPDPGPSPFESTASSEAARLFERLLDSLEEDKRDLFVMSELEQMPVPAMAEILGVNLNTLYSRVRAARAAFERALAAWQADQAEQTR